ncbi:hypothetical protein SEA_REINDEER_2 [Mycobacterium phage Reindeer]|uniref:DUF3846 domain-containing protein n=1 Tax=Mycobacterium phage Reindeer TaxID=2762283 RepID=A0A7G8LHU0_9CAUD|nr:hypothetical protein J4U05_gp002 [Mycobacterium phage Reindeer]QNJ56812.1 hypothetical protein SEA_REINDEER_2 [Mycobacterium phage Reindeer]
MTTTGYSATVTAPSIRALIITPEGTREVRMIDQTLPAMRELLGGHIEAVTTTHATFWCNEEGKLLGLPTNPMATYLWWKLQPEMEGLDNFHGTIVVTGPADEAGDSHPVHDAVIDLYERMNAVRSEWIIHPSRDQAPGGETAP